MFSVPVVKVGEILPHENADSLSITEVNGFPVIVKNGSFKPGDLAVYVPVDAVVPTKGEFAFLATKEGQETARIKAKRLRGVFSMGLLIPMGTLKAFEGDNVAEQLGIIKYEEPEKNAPVSMRGNGVSVRKNPVLEGVPYYDLTHYRSAKHLLVPGEEVVITEKLHGTQFKAVYSKAKLFVGSRNHFWAKPSKLSPFVKKMIKPFQRFGWVRKLFQENPETVYWQVASKYMLDLALKTCKDAHDKVFFGEAYGKVQDLKYERPNEVMLRIFDIYDLKTGRFLHYDEMEGLCFRVGLPVVPVLYIGPYDPEIIEPMRNGKSTLAQNQIREGFVIRPSKERRDARHGRVILKHVGEDYLLRKGGGTEFH